MSRLLKDSSQSSLFKSSAMASVQAPDDLSSSRMQLEPSFNATVKSLQSCEVENLSTYVRLDHIRNSEQNKKVVPRFSTAEIVLSRSLLRGKCGVVADAALFQNRRSRVGWGPDLQHLNFQSSTRLSLVTVKTSDLRQNQDPGDDVYSIDSRNPYVVLLSTYLNHTKRNVAEGVPTLRPVSGANAVSFIKAATEGLANKFKSNENPEILHLLNYMRKVWNLCIALWGPLDVESGSHAETMARKETLTQWLEEAAVETNITGLEEEEEVLSYLVYLKITIE